MEGECDVTAAELAILGWLGRWPSSTADLDYRFRRTMGAELKVRMARLIAKGCITKIDRRWWLTGHGGEELGDHGIEAWCTADGSLPPF